MKTKWKNNFLNYDKLFSIVIVLLPFLYQYKGIGNVISFGELLLFPFIFIYLLFMKKNKKNICLTYELLFYFTIII